MQKGPLTLVDIVGFYAGRRTVYNVLKLAFLDRDRHPRNVYYSPAHDIPMHPAAGHFDVEIAHEIGMPGAYDQGWMRIGWAGHLLTNWCGDWASRAGSTGGDGPQSRRRHDDADGQDHDKRKEDDEALVDIGWWGTNQRGERNCDGRPWCACPRGIRRCC